MREEAKDKDRWLMESLDEREQHTREWWMWEVNKLNKMMFHQMFLVIKDARCGRDESSISRPARPNYPRDSSC